MKAHEPIRVLFSRENAIVFPKLGVFLAGPTPYEGQMHNGWRRVIINKLKEDARLDPSMIVVAPEPETGYWNDIDNKNPKTRLEVIEDKQISCECNI